VAAVADMHRAEIARLRGAGATRCAEAMADALAGWLAWAAE
jgi:hypothetical protein